MDNHSKLSDIVSTLASTYIKTFVGVDGPSKALQRARDDLSFLRRQGADREVDDLLRAGCKELPLAIAVNSSKILNGLPGYYDKMFGNRKALTFVSEELESTALFFEALPLDELPLDELQPRLSSQQFFRDRVISPILLYKFLRDEFYALMKQIMNRCVKERYALSAYAKSATGDPHDREVSLIISIVTGEELHENALCVWRKRGFEKIVGWPFELLWRFAEELEKAHYKNS